MGCCESKVSMDVAIMAQRGRQSNMFSSNRQNRYRTFHIRLAWTSLLGKRSEVDIKNLDEVPAFTTKDGSEIRELLAHRNSVIRNQSLAEARIPVGGSTLEHFHPRAEEIYFVTAGSGKMRIEN